MNLRINSSGVHLDVRKTTDTTKHAGADHCTKASQVTTNKSLWHTCGLAHLPCLYHTNGPRPREGAHMHNTVCRHDGSRVRFQRAVHALTGGGRPTTHSGCRWPHSARRPPATCRPSRATRPSTPPGRGRGIGVGVGVGVRVRVRVRVRGRGRGRGRGWGRGWGRGRGRAKARAGYRVGWRRVRAVSLVHPEVALSRLHRQLAAAWS